MVLYVPPRAHANLAAATCASAIPHLSMLVTQTRHKSHYRACILRAVWQYGVLEIQLPFRLVRWNVKICLSS